MIYSNENEVNVSKGICLGFKVCQKRGEKKRGEKFNQSNWEGNVNPCWIC